MGAPDVVDNRRVSGLLSTHRGVIIPVSLLGALVLAAYLAPLPFEPLEPSPMTRLQPPSGVHWFGTDNLGFDVFSRTVAAAKLDIPLALGGTGVSLLLGVFLGLLASTRSRWADVLMRGLDMFQAFPLLVFAMVVVTMIDDRISGIVIGIALIHTPRFVRVTRSRALSLRESRFVEAAVAIGASRARILSRHLLPNLLGIIAAQASLAAAHGIIVIAGLSFLGIGISPPEASWGAMIRIGAADIARGHWWPVMGPGLAIFITVFSFNAIAQHGLTRFERTLR